MVEIDLPAGVAQKIPGPEGDPIAGVDGDVGVRRQDHRASGKVGRLALDFDLRRQGELRARHFFRARHLGENAGHASRSQLHGAGGFDEENRAVGGVCGVEARVGGGPVIREEIDPAVQRGRGGAVDDAELPHGFSDDRHVGARGVDEAVVGGGAGRRLAATRGIAHFSDIDIQPAEARVAARMRGESDLKAGGENRLAVRRRDRSLVHHIGPDEGDPPADMFRRRGSGERSAILHHDIAEAAVGPERGGGSECRGRTFRSGREGGGREEKLGVRVVEQAAGDEAVVDRQGRRDQRVRVHLAARPEDDPVAIDEVNLSGGFDRAEDLRRLSRGIADFVEGDPCPGVAPAGRLVETHGRVPADIERLPVQERLLAGLLDGDEIAGLDGGVGPAPDTADQPLQPSSDEAVGHGDSVCRTGGSLHLAHRVEHLSGARQPVCGFCSGHLGGCGTGIGSGIRRLASRTC